MAAPAEIALSPLIADHPRTTARTHSRPVAAIRTPLPWRRFWALIALPVALVALMIARFGVDTPHYDQWTGESPLFEKMGAGTLGPADFLAQHNEHRLPVPRLVMFAAGVLTHWNTKVEMFLTLLALLAVAANYWRLLRATGWSDGPRTHGAFFVLAALTFSLTQYQNFLWGFQLHFVSSIVFFTACCWVAAAVRAPWNFAAVMLLATAATFSIASGFVCWILAVPLLLLPRGEARARGLGKWWAVYAAAFAANLTLYFTGYRKPENHPALDAFLHDPSGTARYLAAYVGGPFGLGTAFDAVAASTWIGAALLAAMACAAAEMWRRRAESAVIARALPWFMISCFGLANAAITTVGRLGFGTAQALESRYGTYALLVPVGLLPVFGALLGRRRGEMRAFPFAALAVSALLTLSILSSVRSLEDWRVHQRAYRMEKALVQTVHWISEPELLRSNVTPDSQAIRQTVRALGDLGYLRPPPWQSGAISEAGDPADGGAREFGHMEGGRRANDQIFLSGWAVLPDRRRTADAVLITCDDAGGMPTLIGLAPVTFDRPDVEAARGSRAYFGCGWAVQWPASRIPAPGGAIKAWAYDAEERRAFRLHGLVTLAR